MDKLSARVEFTQSEVEVWRELVVFLFQRSHSLSLPFSGLGFAEDVSIVEGSLFELRVVTGTAVSWEVVGQ